MSTLQRRRVAGGAAENGSGLGGGPDLNASNGSLGDGNGSLSSRPETPDGRRIAYDPEDIIANESRNSHPPLTLMEEVLLLGLKDRQGYLSFWNDNISYALRGCILMELAFRGKIAMVNDSMRRNVALCDRYIEVIDHKLTGEALLDETIKLMKTSEPLSVATWIDYLSGETWNLTKISYQLKQVRERLSKGLVDKGVLRTERRNFFLFDMATHPVVDAAPKDDIKRRVVSLLTARTLVLPTTKYYPEFPLRTLRAVALVGGAYAANVLENALTNLGYESREQAFTRSEQLLSEYCEWPFLNSGQQPPFNLADDINTEVSEHPELSLSVEIVAAVLSVYTKIDALM